MAINEFMGKYRFLSNFYPCSVEFGGMSFRSAEHAYQAAKTEDMDERRAIQALAKAGDAKKAGYRVTPRSNWNEIKLQIMEEIVRDKFRNNKRLGEQLLATGNEDLIEGNWWNDTFWGVCRGKGENHLGKILMRIREDLRKEEHGLVEAGS